MFYHTSNLYDPMIGYVTPDKYTKYYEELKIYSSLPQGQQYLEATINNLNNLLNHKKEQLSKLLLEINEVEILINNSINLRTTNQHQT